MTISITNTRESKQPTGLNVNVKNKKCTFQMGRYVSLNLLECTNLLPGRSRWHRSHLFPMSNGYSLSGRLEDRLLRSKCCHCTRCQPARESAVIMSLVSYRVFSAPNKTGM